MKLVVLACLAAVAIAAPQSQDVIPVVQVLRDDRQDDGNGIFNYAFETENGIAMEASGTPGSQGQSNMQGSFRFVFPEGNAADVRYIADENGFQPQSDLLPTDHPLPAHVIDLIRMTEELRAAGATWDEQGRRLTR
ncbi:cuticle protein AM1239-like [Panulirus ornatus]|uniref:cuticle protein AM1239-like n=1 Tax=Panulirus ornatus TaxID=150431 RepID=UPI003A8C4A80